MKTIQIRGRTLEELESAIMTIIFEIDRWCDDSNFDNGDELGNGAKLFLRTAASNLEDARTGIGRARMWDEADRVEVVRFEDNIFETGEV